MARIINIETSTKVCSLSISENNNNLFERIDYTNASHAKQLGLFTQEAILYIRKNNLSIDAIAVSAGPGSYTGLRIGVSEAKGLCYGLDIPLIAIPTLKIMANALDLNTLDESTYLCPMIDARRMEVYTALYDKNLTEIIPVHAKILDENSFSDTLAQHKVVFFGDGAEKFKGVVSSANALFVDNIHPLASSMASLSCEAFNNSQFVDTAYFDPFYLKEFQATVPKNKVLQ